jgi:hypothetical protein
LVGEHRLLVLNVAKMGEEEVGQGHLPSSPPFPTPTRPHTHIQGQR